MLFLFWYVLFSKKYGLIYFTKTYYWYFKIFTTFKNFPVVYIFHYIIGPSEYICNENVFFLWRNNCKTHDTGLIMCNYKLAITFKLNFRLKYILHCDVVRGRERKIEFDDGVVKVHLCPTFYQSAPLKYGCERC